MSTNIELTVFRKRDGILTKEIKLDRDGKICSDGSACRMAEGEAYRTKLNGVASLAKLIEQMPSEQALALGRLRSDLPDRVKVILAKDLHSKRPTDVIARTTAYLQFAPEAPAYMLLDYDRKGQPRAVSDKLKALGRFWPAIITAAPGLAAAARVLRWSTSAGLYHRETDEWLRGSAGRHVYVAVKDGSDIERTLKSLHDRLWLAGLGYFVVGAAGQLLERSIIDAAVYGPERLVFEGAPVVVPPVAQDKKQRKPEVHEGDVIDTLAAIPPLTEDEQARLAQLKAAARDRLKPEAALERRRWAKIFAARHGLSESEAEKIAANATERHLLHRDFELVFDEFGAYTVGEVLDAADDFVEESLADPLEGTPYGRGKAKVFRQPDGTLMVNSYAHGGIKYRLADQGVGLDDFFANMEQHNYLYAPRRTTWPASSVNARIPPVPLVNAKGEPVLDESGKQKRIKASDWLDHHRPVEQFTWAPGLPVLIENRLLDQGGWIVRQGVRCFNFYRQPNPMRGDADAAGPWLDLVHKVYPDDADHIIKFNAHRVQRPAEKINHSLVMGGLQGIGKDSILAPVRVAVGDWNFREVSPIQAMGRFNECYKGVIVRINEARDLGETDRYKFYDHMKSYMAAPPEVLRVDEKHLREYYILNCCGVIITTNHKTDGIYLPGDDRRHYVAWSELSKKDFGKDKNACKAYWNGLWHWYKHDGGFGHVAAYLRELDIGDFDAKAPPPQTAAFHAIVGAGRAPENAEIADLIDAMAKQNGGQPPQALIIDDLRLRALGEVLEWLGDRKNRRVIPHRLENSGYEAFHNSTATDGMWVVDGHGKVIYVRAELPAQDKLKAARERAKEPIFGRRYRNDGSQ
jgi:hypothetical protein